jgi:hypothetical protein
MHADARRDCSRWHRQWTGETGPFLGLLLGLVLGWLTASMVGLLFDLLVGLFFAGGFRVGSGLMLLQRPDRRAALWRSMLHLGYRRWGSRSHRKPFQSKDQSVRLNSSLGVIRPPRFRPQGYPFLPGEMHAASISEIDRHLTRRLLSPTFRPGGRRTQIQTLGLRRANMRCVNCAYRSVSVGPRHRFS